MRPCVQDEPGSWEHMEPWVHGPLHPIMPIRPADGGCPMAPWVHAPLHAVVPIRPEDGGGAMEPWLVA